ncbi:hypothetical protein P692DRAFT_20816267 [Suillus brevipes Sb2]|nr:hypothetical protein P692DRAFT_20816267 [Suillus brevipes Sb2]
MMMIDDRYTWMDAHEQLPGSLISAAPADWTDVELELRGSEGGVTAATTVESCVDSNMARTMGVFTCKAIINGESDSVFLAGKRKIWRYKIVTSVLGRPHSQQQNSKHGAPWIIFIYGKQTIIVNQVLGVAIPLSTDRGVGAGHLPEHKKFSVPMRE